MSISVTANRIHARERIMPEDIAEMGPDELLVRGVMKPTTTTGGLLTPSAGAVGELKTEERIPVRASVVFEVAKLPRPENMTRGNPLELKVGDIVLCRNVLVDPLFGGELGITNLYLGVTGVIERAREVET